ncbi:unnamed protein product [Amoebophrya sp. A120]|nr:unnamed protein product [Amoebophrya sp. A120]|eukprot:GSA120T00011998001.1
MKKKMLKVNNTSVQLVGGARSAPGVKAGSVDAGPLMKTKLSRVVSLHKTGHGQHFPEGCVVTDRNIKRSSTSTLVPASSSTSSTCCRSTVAAAARFLAAPRGRTSSASCPRPPWSHADHNDPLVLSSSSDLFLRHQVVVRGYSSSTPLHSSSSRAAEGTSSPSSSQQVAERTRSDRKRSMTCDVEEREKHQEVEDEGVSLSFTRADAISPDEIDQYEEHPMAGTGSHLTTEAILGGYDEEVPEHLVHEAEDDDNMNTDEPESLIVQRRLPWQVRKQFMHKYQVKEANRQDAANGGHSSTTSALLDLKTTSCPAFGYRPRPVVKKLWYFLEDRDRSGIRGTETWHTKPACHAWNDLMLQTWRDREGLVAQDWAHVLKAVVEYVYDVDERQLLSSGVAMATTPLGSATSAGEEKLKQLATTSKEGVDSVKQVFTASTPACTARAPPGSCTFSSSMSSDSNLTSAPEVLDGTILKTEENNDRVTVASAAFCSTTNFHPTDAPNVEGEQWVEAAEKSAASLYNPWNYDQDGAVLDDNAQILFDKASIADAPLATAADADDFEFKIKDKSRKQVKGSRFTWYELPEHRMNAASSSQQGRSYNNSGRGGAPTQPRGRKSKKNGTATHFDADDGRSVARPEVDLLSVEVVKNKSPQQEEQTEGDTEAENYVEKPEIDDAAAAPRHADLNESYAACSGTTKIKPEGKRRTIEDDNANHARKDDNARADSNSTNSRGTTTEDFTMVRRYRHSMATWHIPDSIPEKLLRDGARTLKERRATRRAKRLALSKTYLDLPLARAVLQKALESLATNAAHITSVRTAAHLLITADLLEKLGQTSEHLDKITQIQGAVVQLLGDRLDLSEEADITRFEYMKRPQTVLLRRKRGKNAVENMEYPGKMNRLDFSQLCFVYKTIARRSAHTHNHTNILVQNWTESLAARLRFEKTVDPRACFSIAHAWLLLNPAAWGPTMKLKEDRENYNQNYSSTSTSAASTSSGTTTRTTSSSRTTSFVPSSKSKRVDFIKNSGLLYLAALGVERSIRNRLPVSIVDALSAFECFVVCNPVYPKLRQKVQEFTVSLLRDLPANLLYTQILVLRKDAPKLGTVSSAPLRLLRDIAEERERKFWWFLIVVLVLGTRQRMSRTARRSSCSRL